MRYILTILVLVFVASSIAETTDAATAMGSVSGASGDAFLDELDYFALDALGASDYCVGVGFDGTNFWVTDAADVGGVGSNTIWVISGDAAHTVVTSFLQFETAGWGLRDLCCDGTYMFGSQDNEVDIYDIGTYAYVGYYVSNAVSPNRAQAWDGTNFYTGSFAAEVYQITWDGVLGSTATYSLWSSAVANDGTYGAAWDAYNDCLWVSTASYDDTIYQIDSSGALIAAHFYGINIAGGCTMGSYSGSYDEQLWVLEQGSPDGVRCFETGPLALEQHSWGGIKVLF
jgi:hypothetical protein